LEAVKVQPDVVPLLVTKNTHFKNLRTGTDVFNPEATHGFHSADQITELLVPSGLRSN
jgi:hypothetical protein